MYSLKTVITANNTSDMYYSADINKHKFFKGKDILKVL